MRRISVDDVAKDFAGQSLRIGYCTEAAKVRLQPHKIHEQSGHKSDVTLAV